MIPNWLRKLPHPTYGYYGGANKKCNSGICPVPIDWMDMAFARHDMDLEMGDEMADMSLAVRLRDGDPKLLGWYGRVYRRSSMLIFR